MFKNYLLVAIRNMLRNKTVSLIHVTGFGIGIAAFLFVAEMAIFEYSFDKFHKNGNRIFQIAADCTFPNGKEFKFNGVEPALAPLLKNSIPEIIHAARFIPQRLEEPYCVVTYIDAHGNRKSFNELNVGYADEDFLKIFAFEIVQGNSTPLLNPDGLVMTSSCAMKYFGEENPIGKTLEITTGGTESNKTKFSYQVETILKDIPSNSSLQFEILLPFRAFEDNYKTDVRNNWQWHFSFPTFIELSGHDIDVSSLESKIYHTVPVEVRNDWISTRIKALNYQLQNITEIHFNAEYIRGSVVTWLKVTDRSYLLILILIGFAILVIAEMNYVSLTTAKALGRVKEISIRKVVGAGRTQLVEQFFFDACLNVVAGLVFALTLLQLIKPLLAKWLGVSVPHFSDWNHQSLFFVFLFLVSVILMGFVPAFYMSARFPVSALKGKINHAPGGGLMRKCLVVFQFTTSVILICITYVIVAQLHFMQSKDTGISMDQRIAISTVGTEDFDFQKFRKFKERTEMIRNVLSVTAGTSIPGRYEGGSPPWSTSEKLDESSDVYLSQIIVESDYMKTLNIPIIAGREFTVDRVSGERACLINETALRTIGAGSPTDAIGKSLYFHWVNENKEVKIIGVVGDGNFISPGNAIDPIVFTFANTTYPFPKYRNYIVHVSAGQLNATIDNIKKVWELTFEDAPFEYSFVDDTFQQVFEKEEKMKAVATLASVLAIFIACMGLGALVAYSVTQRTKEIGIRKVLGASIGRILYLLSSDFLKLILTAVVLAVPLTWYAANEFLKTYEYRIQLSIWIFILPSILLLLIAVITTIHQTIKAANGNPIDALKCE